MLVITFTRGGTFSQAQAVFPALPRRLSDLSDDDDDDDDLGAGPHVAPGGRGSPGGPPEVPRRSPGGTRFRFVVSTPLLPEKKTWTTLMCQGVDSSFEKASSTNP